MSDRTLLEDAARRRPLHKVGAADDCAPDSAGCCGCTVTERCTGCPHGAGTNAELFREVAALRVLLDERKAIDSGRAAASIGRLHGEGK